MTCDGTRRTPGFNPASRSARTSATDSCRGCRQLLGDAGQRDVALPEDRAPRLQRLDAHRAVVHEDVADGRLHRDRVDDLRPLTKRVLFPEPVGGVDGKGAARNAHDRLDLGEFELVHVAERIQVVPRKAQRRGARPRDPPRPDRRPACAGPSTRPSTAGPMSGLTPPGPARPPHVPAAWIAATPAREVNTDMNVRRLRSECIAMVVSSFSRSAPCAGTASCLRGTSSSAPDRRPSAARRRSRRSRATPGCAHPAWRPPSDR